MNTNRPETALDLVARLIKGAMCSAFHREHHRRVDVRNRRVLIFCSWECLRCGLMWEKTIRPRRL